MVRPGDSHGRTEGVRGRRKEGRARTVCVKLEPGLDGSSVAWMMRCGKCAASAPPFAVFTCRTAPTNALVCAVC